MFKLRSGNNALNSHQQRKQNIPFDLRRCSLCFENSKEDFYHLLECQAMVNERNVLNVKLQIISFNNFPESNTFRDAQFNLANNEIVTSLWESSLLK